VASDIGKIKISKENMVNIQNAHLKPLKRGIKNKVFIKFLSKTL